MTKPRKTKRHDPNWNPVSQAIAEARDLYQRVDHGIVEPPKPKPTKREIPGQLSLVEPEP